MSDHEFPSCLPDEHTFSRTRDTNEPTGRCHRCGATLAWVEDQAESEPPLAFADVPASETEAYLAALDAESVRENR